MASAKSRYLLIDGVDTTTRSAINPPSIRAALQVRKQRSSRWMHWPSSANVQSQRPRSMGRVSGAVNAVINPERTSFMARFMSSFATISSERSKFLRDAPRREERSVQAQIGGTVGGPIKHDQTFFFAAFEGERGRPSSSLAVTVPSAADIASARAANAAAGRSENALGAKILGLFPQENIPRAKANFAYSLPNIIDSDNFVIKSITASAIDSSWAAAMFSATVTRHSR